MKLKIRKNNENQGSKKLLLRKKINNVDKPLARLRKTETVHKSFNIRNEMRNTTDPEAIKRIIRSIIIPLYLPSEKKRTICLELQTTTTKTRCS